MDIELLVDAIILGDMRKIADIIFDKNLTNKVRMNIMAEFKDRIVGSGSHARNMMNLYKLMRAQSDCLEGIMDCIAYIHETSSASNPVTVDHSAGLRAKTKRKAMKNKRGSGRSTTPHIHKRKIGGLK